METKHSNYIHYSEEELQIIKDFYPKYGATGEKGVCARIKKRLNIERSSLAIGLMARKLGIKYEGKRKGAFVKGCEPHNKGKKMKDSTKKKCSKTWFVKGRTPHNAKSSWTITKRRVGSKSKSPEYFIKIPGRRKQVLLKKYLYEIAHKVRLSKDDLIRFKDGNTENFAIENLECINRYENLMKNITVYPDEVIQAMQAIKELKKAIENGKKQIN